MYTNYIMLQQLKIFEIFSDLVFYGFYYFFAGRSVVLKFWLIIQTAETF